MNKRLVVSALFGCMGSILLASTAWGTGQQSFRVRLGLFEPDGDSIYWRDKELDFFGDVSDFEDTVVGIDYVMDVHPILSLIFSMDYYQGESEYSYRDFVEPGGRGIFHDTRLDITPLTFGLAFNLTPPRSPVRLFVGAGGGLYLWRLEETGDFIDFDVFPSEIFFGRFVVEGEEFGYYLHAGLEVPFGRSLSFVADARWDDVDADLNGDFAGFGTMDMSGARYSAGIGWRF